MAGKSILVVDDEAMVLDALRITLRHFGHSITTAADPFDALRLFAQEKFDLVITDLKMPGMNGVQLAAELRKSVPSIPIVLLTGFAPESVGKVVDLVLLKPFSTADLRNAVDRLTSQSTSGSDV